MIDQSKDLTFQIDNKLGDVVRAWREARKITVTELAARCGEPISKGYISEIENNKIRNPNDEYLIRIAAALEIPVEYLVLRRLPDEQLEASDRQEGKAAFVFGTPLVSPQRVNNSSKQKDSEEEELEQILAELEEEKIRIIRLQKRVKKLLTQKRMKKSPKKEN